MNVTVFGATGAIGSLTVAELLNRGHTVTAYARNAAKVPSSWGERVRVVIGEMSDADAIDTAVAGADAVVSALGPSMDRKATGLPLVEGTQHILDAMKRHGVTRYIGHATPAVLDPQEKPTAVTRLIGFMPRTFMRRAYDEIHGMTGPVMASDLDWTLVRFIAPKDTPKGDNVRVGFFGTDKLGSPSPAPTSPRSPPPRSTTPPTSAARPPSATDRQALTRHRFHTTARRTQTLMTIAIIGVTGQLGALTVDALLDRGTPAGDILALARNTEKLQAYADRGLRTAALDLDEVDATAAQLDGVEKLLLISVGAPGQALGPRGNAIEAARRAGVGHLIYTSALLAPTTILSLAAEHKATEELITASGTPATFLRNGWYTENHQQEFAAAREQGVIANSVGDGRLATASRKDFAEAAAVVLTGTGHEGRAYELSGDTAWSYEEFAAIAQQVLGQPVSYQPLTPEQEREQLLAFDLDEGTAGFMVALHANMRDDALAPTPGDLARLIGRPTEPLETTMRTWV